MTKLFF